MAKKPKNQKKPKKWPKNLKKLEKMTEKPKKWSTNQKKLKNDRKTKKIGQQTKKN